MPGLITVTGDMLFPVEIAQDESVIGEPGMDLFPDLRVLHHILVVVDIGERTVVALQLEIEVQRKTGVMLGEAGSGYGLCRVVRAVFFNKAVHDVLLSRDTAAGGIQFKVNAFVFFEVLFQGEIGVVGFCLNLHLVSHGVGDRDGLQRTFPALRQGVELIDQRQIIDPGGFVCLRPGAHGAGTEKQHRDEEKDRESLHFTFLLQLH